MASFYDTTVGQQTEFQRVLATAGFTNGDVARIIKEPNLAAAMYSAIQPKVDTHKATESVVERVEQHLNRWRELGVVVSDEQWENILQQADVFEPVTDSDEPLVTGGFGYHNPSRLAKKLFAAFMPTNGYSKVNYIEGAELRYTPGFEPTGGLRLVHYDPNAYAGLSPEAAVEEAKRDNLRLAGIEVLEHLILEPTTGNIWDGKLYFFPNLSGLQLKYDTDWPDVPHLRRWDDVRQLKLHANWADHAGAEWASPSVREC